MLCFQTNTCPVDEVVLWPAAPTTLCLSECEQSGAAAAQVQVSASLEVLGASRPAPPDVVADAEPSRSRYLIRLALLAREAGTDLTLSPAERREWDDLLLDALAGLRPQDRAAVAHLQPAA